MPELLLLPDKYLHKCVPSRKLIFVLFHLKRALGSLIIVCPVQEWSNVSPCLKAAGFTNETNLFMYEEDFRCNWRQSHPRCFLCTCLAMCYNSLPQLFPSACAMDRIRLSATTGQALNEIRINNVQLLLNRKNSPGRSTVTRLVQNNNLNSQTRIRLGDHTWNIFHRTLVSLWFLFTLLSIFHVGGFVIIQGLG